MKTANISKSLHTKIIASVIIVVLLATAAIYDYNKNKLLDKTLFKNFFTSLEAESSNFKSNDDLMTYISNWAEEKNASYTVDNAKNIIFHHSATIAKQDVKPTVICVDYNYKNCALQSKSLASAICCATSNIPSSEYTVIFFNNENNNGYGYSQIEKSYFPDNAKIIFINHGKKTSITRESYSMEKNSLKIPAKIESNTFDSAVTITISGASSDVINNTMNSYPNYPNIMLNILQKLKNKSIAFKIADIKIADNGNMYPSDMSLTILYNSYSEKAIVDYLDDKKEDFNKSNKSDFTNAEFQYQIISDENLLPKTTYSQNTSDSIYTALFAIKNGIYKYTEQDAPDGYKKGDIYAINCITSINSTENEINLDMVTSAINKSILDKIVNDNSTAAEFAGASLQEIASHDRLTNAKKELYDELHLAYFRLNALNGTNLLINKNIDASFNSCSYLSELNPNMDIVHIAESDDASKIITSTLFYYIQMQGNPINIQK